MTSASSILLGWHVVKHADFVNVADEVGLYLIERSGKGARVYVFAPGLLQVQVQAEMCSRFDVDELERRTEVNLGI